jgi:type I restriction enzyme S subunit
VYIARGRRNLSLKGISSSGATLLPKGTVLYSSRAPIGYCAIASSAISTNQGFKSLVLSKEILPEFVRYYLLSSKAYAESLASGTTFKELSGARMAQLPLPIAPKIEQRRIVKKLNEVTFRSKRASNELSRIPKLTDRYKQAVLARQMSADEDGSEWPRVALGDLISEGPTNGYSPRAGENPNGTLSLKLTATTRGVLDLSARAIKRLNEVIEPTSKFWLRPGDILIQRANSLDYVGVAAIYEGPLNTYIYPDLMIRIRVNSAALGRWIWRYCSSAEARKYFVDNATGTAGNMPKINGSTIRGMLIPVPPTDRLDATLIKIDNALDGIDKMEKASSKARSLLSRLDQSILEKAFRGQLALSDNI